MIKEDYLRHIVFGFEDGFVSTVGALVGVAASNSGKSYIIITGLIIIAVEALSMGFGSYITEKSAHELGRIKHSDNLFLDGILMWSSYTIAGLCALTPYFFIEPTQSATVASILITLTGLFWLGFTKGKLVHKNPIKSGLEIMLLAGLAILVGFGVGTMGRQILLNS